ncbi:uncharacterized protein LOC126749591 [Anthonomus grandis grandis]|uniref:uncharacterized protein LOC126749591 n=1 Tax=Anthonomus grandis grandis TaxID=2921223 RepID=UPI0021656E5E|nr:uncharacterized protein LOC126749591 [Anthonomus grandis grandis]XP_050315265.1 uncharacterized protein LOC126749591 [Anthonomus grandis grandis]
MTDKRKYLSIKEKMKIIEVSETTGLSSRKLAQKFQVGKTQVTNLLKNKADIRRRYQEGGNDERKRIFPKKKLAVDQLVYKWFCQTRSRGISITRGKIQATALKAAECLGLDNFKASTGWLEKFRRRHNIILKEIPDDPVFSKDIDELVDDEPLISEIKVEEPGIYEVSSAYEANLRNSERKEEIAPLLTEAFSILRESEIKKEETDELFATSSISIKKEKPEIHSMLTQPSLSNDSTIFRCSEIKQEEPKFVSVFSISIKEEKPETTSILDTSSLSDTYADILNFKIKQEEPEIVPEAHDVNVEDVTWIISEKFEEEALTYAIKDRC